jgi:hypothetical protein
VSLSLDIDIVTVVDASSLGGAAALPGDLLALWNWHYRRKLKLPWGATSMVNNRYDCRDGVGSWLTPLYLP